MTAPIFPSVEQIFNLLAGEMPEGVYAQDRADDLDPNKRSYSSAEIRAHAQMLAQAYSNLRDVDDDKFITTVTPAGLAPWEKELFPTAQDSTQSYAVRQANLLAKFRASGGISKPAIEDIVHAILDPHGLAFEIVQWNGADGGAWVLDESELDTETYLSLADPLLGQQQDQTPLDCNLDYVAAGITADQLASIQETAYTYEVRIFGVADAQTLAQLDQALTEYEPARSTHLIINDFPAAIDPDLVDMGAFTGDTLIDVIDCGRFLVPGATYDVWDFFDNWGL